VKKVAFLLVVIAGCVYCYNTIWFQSMFNDSFYKSIVDAPFNVSQNEERLTVPLKYKYKTCYEVGLAVPGRDLSDTRKAGKGLMGYKFVFKGKTLASGVTQPVVGPGWSGDDHISIRPLIVFDLPFPGASEGLFLTLEVIEPFVFLEEYKGETSIIIRPNYEPKVGKCYDEDLRIQY